MNSKLVFLVIGMHRSGTSLTMQALGQLGLASGDDLLPGNDYNQRGYWEAAEVVALHDQLLSELDRPWGSFKHLLPLPSDWMSSPTAERACGDIVEILRARLSKQGDAKAIAIKDPRMSLFLPLWQEAALKMGVTLRTIICLRNPWDVAQSLLRRDTIPLEAGQLLSLLYTATALHYVDPESTLLSYFENWTDDPAVALAQLARFTGTTPSGDLTVFESALTTQTTPLNDPVLQRWHGLLEQCRATGQVTDRIQLEALHHLENARHFQTWTNILGDGELQKEMTMSLARELRHLQGDRDAQVERAEELLAAYTAEATRAADLRADLDAMIIDRDAHAELAKELLAAYHTEAARSAELQAAYQTEAARSAELQTRLETVNPFRLWLERWKNSSRGS